MLRDLSWSPAEKKTARRAFDAALERECRAIRVKVVEILESSGDVRQIWRVHDYLSAERRKVDEKYDYRYSRLIHVLGVLLHQGWISAADLTGLAEDKLQPIKNLAKLYAE